MATDLSITTRSPLTTHYNHLREFLLFVEAWLKGLKINQSMTIEDKMTDVFLEIVFLFVDVPLFTSSAFIQHLTFKFLECFL